MSRNWNRKFKSEFYLECEIFEDTESCHYKQDVDKYFFSGIRHSYIIDNETKQEIEIVRLSIKPRHDLYRPPSGPPEKWDGIIINRDNY